MTLITLVLGGVDTWLHGVAHYLAAVLTDPIPKVNDTKPPSDLSKKISDFLGVVQWFAYGACVLGVIVFGGRMGLAWHNGSEVKIGQFGLILLGAILIASATSIIGSVVN